jgi:hypothetical protein
MTLHSLVKGLSPWLWRQYAPLKRRYTSAKLQSAISHKAVFIFAAVIIWSLTNYRLAWLSSFRKKYVYVRYNSALQHTVVAKCGWWFTHGHCFVKRLRALLTASQRESVRDLGSRKVWRMTSLDTQEAADSPPLHTLCLYFALSPRLYSAFAIDILFENCSQKSSVDTRPLK